MRGPAGSIDSAMNNCSKLIDERLAAFREGNKRRCIVNILQARILGAGKKRVDTRPRSEFLCIRWSAENQSGIISDSTGFRFDITVDDLAPECEGHLEPGEKISGIVDGPTVTNILVESGPRSIEILHERPEFDSVGPAPEVRGWQPRGTPDRGKGTPDSGRFSHPIHHDEKK